jgi:hypothetical protein
MKKPYQYGTRLVLVVIAILVISCVLWKTSPVAAAPPANSASPPAPAAKGDGRLFTAFVVVLRNPRCINCHSQGDFPRQGDDGHPHTMNVQRGLDGHGVTAEKCSTCHQDYNPAGAHLPPGAPNWGLPPASTPMIWQGLTDAQICRSIKDPKQNRNRNLDQLVEHLTEDKLVGWAWNPGEGRTPIPMPHDEFAVKVKQWRDAGAPCP